MIRFIKDSYKEFLSLPIILRGAIIIFLALICFFIGYGITALNDVKITPKEQVKSDSLKLKIIQDEKNSIDSLLSIDPDSGVELLRSKYGIEISK
jgi:hypothetical protein